MKDFKFLKRLHRLAAFYRSHRRRQFFLPGFCSMSVCVFELSQNALSLKSLFSHFAAYHSKTIHYGLKTKEEISRCVTVRKISPWFTLVSFFCFGSPFSHREHIAVARRNSEVRGDEKTWPAYIEDLVREWSTFNLAVWCFLLYISFPSLTIKSGNCTFIVSVLLPPLFALVDISTRASMGLLSAPGLDPATRIAALLSVILTLGSVIMSIYLLWRHQSGVEYNVSCFEDLMDFDISHRQRSHSSRQISRKKRLP